MATKNTKTGNTKTGKNANKSLQEFLAQRKAKAEAIALKKAQAKTRKKAPKYLKKENFIVAQIYNAGEAGITVEELIQLGADRVHPVTGEKDPVSEVTINHNWNVQKATLDDLASQRGELKLRDPQALLKDGETTKKQSIGEVYFSYEEYKKGLNLVKLEFGHETLKNYLLKEGAFEDENGELKPIYFFEQK